MIPHVLGFALVLALAVAPARAGAADPPPTDSIIDDQLKAQKSAARLCGTWQWTIHNHRNHQEHKTVIVLLPPGTPAPPDMPQPAKMVVMGDAVYLRWDFQGGFQEDSMLLANEDRRLEGTFTNSAGDWGAITGKRIAPCSK
ncbi:MAG TPA: hypothetical protein VES96_01465 [Nitrospiraceae bacterium]|nr:hypothetical protein [Nitrospiraceae bacterium]